MSSARPRPRALLVAGAAALVACLLLAPGADASVRCRHTLPPADELRVFPYEDPHIDLDFADGVVRRDGNRILVLDVLNGEVKMHGGPPPPSPTPARSSSCRVGSPSALSTSRAACRRPTSSSAPISAPSATGPWSAATARTDGCWAAPRARSASPSTQPRPQIPQVTWDGLGQNVPVIVPGKGKRHRRRSRRSAPPHHHPDQRRSRGTTRCSAPRFGDAIQGGPGATSSSAAAATTSSTVAIAILDRLDCGAGAKDKAKLGREDTVKGCERIERPGHGHKGGSEAPVAKLSAVAEGRDPTRLTVIAAVVLLCAGAVVC